MKRPLLIVYPDIYVRCPTCRKPVELPVSAMRARISDQPVSFVPVHPRKRRRILGVIPRNPRCPGSLSVAVIHTSAPEGYLNG